MSLAPTILERLARARADLRMGVPVVLTSGDAALLVIAAETLHQDRLVDFRAIGRPVLAITKHRAQTLKADRKSTRLNSSHVVTSYAVFCFEKKNV